MKTNTKIVLCGAQENLFLYKSIFSENGIEVEFLIGETLEDALKLITEEGKYLLIVFPIIKTRGGIVYDGIFEGKSIKELVKLKNKNSVTICFTAYPSTINISNFDFVVDSFPQGSEKDLVKKAKEIL